MIREKEETAKQKDKVLLLQLRAQGISAATPQHGKPSEVTGTNTTTTSTTTITTTTAAAAAAAAAANDQTSQLSKT